MTDIDRDQLGVLLDALPPIFRDCVSTDPAAGSGRGYFLCYPSVVGESVYASDGRILVRCRPDPGVLGLVPEPPAGRRFPPAAPAMFDEPVGWSSEPVPLPGLEQLPPCLDCAGRGHFAADSPCPACDGEGDEHCPHCGESCRCERCHGRGRVPAGTCVACFGSGIDEDRWHAVPVGGGIRLMANYLAVLRRHGAALYLPRARLAAAGRYMPVRFAVPGSPDVDGLVMPVDWDAPSEMLAPVGEAVRA